MWLILTEKKKSVLFSILAAALLLSPALCLEYMLREKQGEKTEERQAAPAAGECTYFVEGKRESSRGLCGSQG
jgi:hypothetical protein